MVRHSVTCYGLLELLGALVVEDVLFVFDTCACETINEYLVGSIHFAKDVIFEGFLEGCVAVWVRQYHDVLVDMT